MGAVPTIGDLRRRVTLEAYVDLPDDTGGFARSFVVIGKAWAKIEALGAQTQFMEQRLEETRSFAVTLRWRGDVVSQMRLGLGGRKLMVMSVEDPDGAARFLRCLCQEIL
jgi:SPP1 family predicted phage head-tail adaptor